MKRVPPPSNKTGKKPPPPPAPKVIIPPPNLNSQQPQEPQNHNDTNNQMKSQPIDQINTMIQQSSKIQDSELKQQKPSTIQLAEKIQQKKVQLPLPNRPIQNVPPKMNKNPPKNINREIVNINPKEGKLVTEFQDQKQHLNNNTKIVNNLNIKKPFVSQKPQPPKNNNYSRLHQKLKQLSNATEQLQMSDSGSDLQEEVIYEPNSTEQISQNVNVDQNKISINHLINEPQKQNQQIDKQTIKQQNQKLKQQPSILNIFTQNTPISKIEQKKEETIKQQVSQNFNNEVMPIFISEKKFYANEPLKASKPKQKQVQLNQNIMQIASTFQIEKLTSLFRQQKYIYEQNMKLLRSTNQKYRSTQNGIVEEIQQLIQVLKTKDQQVKELLSLY